MMNRKKKQVVVVGNGMAGLRFCEKLLEYDAFHEYRITVLGDEPVPAYDRISLSNIFKGTPTNELTLAEKRWYESRNIELRLGLRVVSINREEKYVTAQSGARINYDILVLATGARPHVPAIPGTGLGGVHVYRTLDDIEAIRRDCLQAADAVVIGGGLLGLEAAEICNETGLKTTVIEQAPHLMAFQLDSTGGHLLRSKIEALGITARTGEQVSRLAGSDTVEAVKLEKGESIRADLVILATGILPNDELGRTAGLKTGTGGGIAIDETVRSSDQSIYAVGECASYNNITFGLVAPCYAMAEAAAAHLGGFNKTFHAGVPASQLKLLDLQVASIGDPLLQEPVAHSIVAQDADRGVYKKLVTCSEGKYLLGAILMGETSEFSRLQKIIEDRTELPDHPENLLAPIGSPFEPEDDMEDDDVVCFCSYVTKGDICRAIDRDNLQSTGDVMGVTYAAGLCGSCLDVVNSVTKVHLSKR
ncbi:MAG TPA: FAD-dependent oxidoreductase [Pontiella sp.]|nr:FAD-dependent oxidoreductase [Pontiella sp.]